MSDFSARAGTYEQESPWILSRDFIEPLVPSPFGNQKMLDVCTGTGVIAEHAAAKGWSVTALDSNPDIIRYVSDRVSVTCGDANQLPFPDNAFDLVVCRQGLQYLDRCQAIRDMLRVCSREARLLHGFIVGEDIPTWKELFRLTNRNNRDFFSDTDIYQAISACHPARIECDFLYSTEKIIKQSDYADEIRRFLLERPAFVERYSIIDQGDHYAYRLKWVVNRMIK
jgi:ubiquinone/menaquinone biosynthesis C-methylase UbiE